MPPKRAQSVKAAATPKVAAVKPKPSSSASAGAPAAVGGGTVHITSSRVCNAFATRASALAAAVTKAVPGAQVVIDAQSALGRKPDVGSFVVSVNGVALVSLLKMPRPFTAMKALDMDDVALRVIASLS